MVPFFFVCSVGESRGRGVGAKIKEGWVAAVGEDSAERGRDQRGAWVDTRHTRHACLPRFTLE